MRLGALIAGGVAAVGAGTAVSLLIKARADDLAARAEVVKKVAAGGAIRLRLTGYWPFTASDSEKKMEGGADDRKGRPLHTVEDFFAGKSDFVSLSGDDKAWPYGQKILIPWNGQQITGRVVDTGQHFRGADKTYRKDGYEPIDVCVYSKATVVPKLVDAQIVKGDHLDKAIAAIATALFKGQDVAVGCGLDYFGVDAA